MSAFNSDTFMEESFLQLKADFHITHVIETGTYHGETAHWLAHNFDTVHTIENNPQHIKEAISVLNGHRNVTLWTGDSSKKLGQMIEACEQDYTSQGEKDSQLLIFLDAHWYSNPVLKELEQIEKSGIKPVIAIHDFQVPDHPEFGFDSYPEQGIIYNWEWIKPHVEKIYKGVEGQKFQVTYNSQAAGSMRGCIFITPLNLAI